MAEVLPQAKWTQRPDLAALIHALGASNMRWVGGAVRDTLLGENAKDVDAATTLLPDAVMERCKAAGIRTVPTGIDHGTVTAILADGPVEITTLRKDVSTDGRRATVAFASEWREDAARRDFTINALYADPITLEISDYFGGLDDLAARRVRFIGDARDRIREDHLRILRYYRFQARFGAALDDEAENACADLADTLKGISRERITMELLALLALPDPAPTVRRMFERGVLPVFLPECSENELAVLETMITREQAENIAPDPLRRLGAMLPPADVRYVNTLAARLRLSKAQKARLRLIADRQDSDRKNPIALAYFKGLDAAQDRLLIAGASLANLHNWEKPQFPLKGGAIVQRGVEAGPQVAQVLQTVEARWVDEGFPDDARIEELVQTVLEELAG